MQVNVESLTPSTFGHITQLGKSQSNQLKQAVNELMELKPYSEGEWLKLEPKEESSRKMTNLGKERDIQLSFGFQGDENKEIEEGGEEEEKDSEDHIYMRDNILRGPIWNYGLRKLSADKDYYDNVIFGIPWASLKTPENMILRGEEWTGKPITSSLIIFIMRKLKKMNPKKTALVELETGRSMTYGELAQKVESLACGLHWLGVQPKQIMAIVSYQSLEAHVMLLACLLIGAVVALVDSSLNPVELSIVLRNTSPNLLFTEVGKTLYKVEAAISYLELSIHNPKPELIINSSTPGSSNYFLFHQLLKEIDGKPVTLDQILNHFEGVIQKHHDLLDKKNQQINDLEDALRNKPRQVPRDFRNVETQSIIPREDNKQDDFAKELALIRKEYEQVEQILTDRNDKLENLIEGLRRKLDQYADEIGHLRQELAARGMDPNESTIMLLKEKEKENDYLKDLINSLKKQPQTAVLPGTTNDDLENEIKKIIEDKKKAVKKLSNMIIELNKTPSQTMESPDNTDVEKECKEMIGDLNNMNDKLNNVLLKLRQTPQHVQGEPVNKDDLLQNLNNLKKQCEDEINALKNQLQSPSEPLLANYGTPVREQPSRTRIPESTQPYEPSRYLAPDPTPESSLKSFRPVNYRPVTPPEVSYRHLPTKPKERLYPEIPSETQSLSPKPRPHSPVSCEACQEDYIPPRSPYVPREDHPPKQKPTHKPAKPKKKGCCGGKGSETSNIPYEKSPEEEEIVYIHQPENSQHKQPRRKKSDHSPTLRKKSDHLSPDRSKTPEDSPKPKRKLVTKLKADRH